MTIPTLTTERLILRPFAHEDLPELAALHSEESFWWYPLRSGMTMEQTAGFLVRTIERYESDGFGIEAVIDRSSGAMIGWAGLAVPHFLPEILPAVEVGWRLAGPFRGNGLATEIGAAAVRWGFTEGGLTRIVSIYEPENVPSGKVMEHLGFTPFLRTRVPERGEEVVVTELTLDQWKARQGDG
ncbi:MAG TPA: GNAT family N-acetyltransferase [Acidimicrobiales bacterium]|nr:GNAT family N-acetyltransferase [Acidimicrobiales bacterium]